MPWRRSEPWNRGGGGVGVNATVFEWPRERVLSDDWLPARFVSEYLIDRVGSWFTDRGIDVVPLGEVAHVGPAGQGIRGAYKPSRHADKRARRALWKNDTERTQSLCAESDTYIVIKPGAEKRADRYWDQRGRLLLANRLSTPSMLLTAVCCGEPLLGSGWLPARPKEHIGNPREWEKAVCVWLNSTPGVLATLISATPKKLVYPQMSLEGQRNIPVPDLTEGQTLRLAEVFDRCRDDVQERLTSVDGPRRILDEAVSEVLGLDEEEVSTARRELAAEPAVTARRYGE